jgi:hypothetical protein
MNNQKRPLSNEDGAIAILVAFILTVLIAFMGLAVDFGYAYLQKSRLQKVADAEALACVISPASAPCPANGTNLYPELNPYGFTVTIVNPGDNSLCLNPATQSKCARATAQTSWNTFFINLFGVNTLNLSATALAARIGKGPSCIVTTGSQTKDFKLNSGFITLSNCDVSSSGDFISAGTGAGINGGSVTVFNGNQCDIRRNPDDPKPPTDCRTVSEPLPQIPSPVMPTINIDGTPLKALDYRQCNNLSCVPAIYTGGKVELTDTTTLASGYYIFKDGFSFNAKGKYLKNAPGGVGIYVPGDKSLEFLGGSVELTGPSTPGCTAGSGIVLSHPFVSTALAEKSVLKLNSFTSLNLTGVVNLTGDTVFLAGTGSSDSRLTITGSLIANSVVLNGDASPLASSNPCFNLYESSGKPVLID